MKVGDEIYKNIEDKISQLNKIFKEICCFQNQLHLDRLYLKEKLSQ